MKFYFYLLILYAFLSSITICVLVFQNHKLRLYLESLTPQDDGMPYENRFVVDIDNAPMLYGTEKAPIIIVLFIDYQCPACAVASEAIDKLYAEFPSFLTIFVRHLPLQRHQENENAIYAALSAYAQGEFSAFHLDLVRNQDRLDSDLYFELAKKHNLDLVSFEESLRSDFWNTLVDENVQASKDLGVESVPTAFINGLKITDVSYRNLKKIIHQELSQKLQ